MIDANVGDVFLGLISVMVIQWTVLGVQIGGSV